MPMTQHATLFSYKDSSEKDQKYSKSTMKVVLINKYYIILY